ARPVGGAHHRRARRRRLSIRPAHRRPVTSAATSIDAVAPPVGGWIVTACAHCGAPISGGGADEFCCGGCASAYAFVRELGLERYYAARTLDPAERRPRPPEDAVQ